MRSPCCRRALRIQHWQTHLWYSWLWTRRGGSLEGGQTRPLGLPAPYAALIGLPLLTTIKDHRFVRYMPWTNGQPASSCFGAFEECIQPSGGHYWWMQKRWEMMTEARPGTPGFLFQLLPSFVSTRPAGRYGVTYLTPNIHVTQHWAWNNYGLKVVQ